LIAIVDVYNSYTRFIVGDSLTHHSGQRFTTRDRDNDVWDGRSCALGRHGAWWYKTCGPSNLNGDYGGEGVSGYAYNFWTGLKAFESLKETIMMVRPKI
jgi:hypothetical protein